jgi:predicted nucleic acid-binding OB-fold protein
MHLQKNPSFYLKMRLSFFHLSSIKGVKRQRAEEIIEERKKGKFHSLEDAYNRLKIPKATLSLYHEFDGLSPLLDDPSRLS